MTTILARVQSEGGVVMGGDSGLWRDDERVGRLRMPKVQTLGNFGLIGFAGVASAASVYLRAVRECLDVFFADLREPTPERLAEVMSPEFYADVMDGTAYDYQSSADLSGLSVLLAFPKRPGDTAHLYEISNDGGILEFDNFIAPGCRFAVLGESAYAVGALAMGADVHKALQIQESYGTYCMAPMLVCYLDPLSDPVTLKYEGQEYVASESQGTDRDAA